MLILFLGIWPCVLHFKLRKEEKKKKKQESLNADKVEVKHYIALYRKNV